MDRSSILYQVMILSSAVEGAVLCGIVQAQMAKTKEKMAPSRASLKLEVRAIEVSHAACKNDFRRNQLPGISQRTFYLFCAVVV